MNVIYFILQLMFLFFIGTTFGWILEFFFRRAVHGKWVNPGFLVGPCLPLYGFGTVALYLISLLYDPLLNATNSKAWSIIIIIVIIGIAMTLIEYIAGVIFIKRMNIKLWDYSNNWGNIQGIICPLFSFFWLVIGALYFLFLHPVMLNVTDWLSKNIVFSFVIGFCFGILMIDFSYSLRLVEKVKKFAKEQDVVVRWENFKEHIFAEAKELKERVHFVNPFRDIQVKEKFMTYVDKYFKKDDK